MYYQSFIRLLRYVDVDTSKPEEINISRTKKLVQAELAMSSTGFLRLDDIDYNKNDILQEFDQPNFIERVGYHQKIWDHPELLELLEKDAIDIPASQKQWFHLHQEEGFRAFLSPYFSGAYQSVMKSLLHSYDFIQAEIWQRFHVFLSPADQDRAFQSTRLFLEESLSLFRNINSQTYLNKAIELRSWENGNWGPFINKLPDSLFPYIDDLAKPIINFTVAVQRFEKPMCLALSEQLCFLTKASPEIKSIILSNHKAFRGVSNSGTNERSGNGFSTWNILWIIAVLAKIVFAMGTCSSKVDDKNYKNKTTPYLRLQKLK